STFRSQFGHGTQHSPPCAVTLQFGSRRKKRRLPQSRSPKLPSASVAKPALTQRFLRCLWAIGKQSAKNLETIRGFRWFRLPALPIWDLMSPEPLTDGWVERFSNSAATTRQSAQREPMSPSRL